MTLTLKRGLVVFGAITALFVLACQPQEVSEAQSNDTASDSRSVDNFRSPDPAELASGESYHVGTTYSPVQEPIKPQHDLAEAGKKVFKERLKDIKALPVMTRGTLLAGDSITQGWRSYDFLEGAVSNHGIGWDTAVGLEARLPEVLRHKPDQMFILIGTNDISYGHTAQDVAGHVKSFIEAFSNESPTTKIYLQSILPREKEALPIVRQYNDALKEMVSETDAKYLDLTSAFAAQDGTLRADLSVDGLHLNEAGYKIWADILNPIINSSQNPD